MTRTTRLGLVVALSAWATPGFAQLGELQAGVVASHGTAEAYGPGGGLVLGVATGRLAYVGLRWLYYAGATAAGVTNRVQDVAVDLGVMIPVGKLDVLVGASLGAARFAQRVGGAWVRKVEFLAAPGVAVEMRVAGVALIPELQYNLSGDPDFVHPVQPRALVASLRLVLPIEVGRIRR